jgi:ribonucleotide monophosphatase NagD (HAD superfamily)
MASISVQGRRRTNSRRSYSELDVVAADAWAVGNSVRSDINPALQAGLRAVLIPRGAWLYEEQQIESRDTIVVPSLKEAAHAILVSDGIAAPAIAGLVG